jgi:hypothetical protein
MKFHMSNRPSKFVGVALVEPHPYIMRRAANNGIPPSAFLREHKSRNKPAVPIPSLFVVHDHVTLAAKNCRCLHFV